MSFLARKVWAQTLIISNPPLCGYFVFEVKILLVQVNFTVDIRAMDDDDRGVIVSEFSRQVYQICNNRMVNCTIEHKVWISIQSWFCLLYV